MTLIPPNNGFRQGHFLIFNSGVSPCKYSVSEVIAYSGISINNRKIVSNIFRKINFSRLVAGS